MDKPKITPRRVTAGGAIVALLAGATVAVIKGVDVSHYQPNTNVANYSMVIAKSTEGVSYRDPSFAGFAAKAKATKTPFAAYHYLHSGRAKAEAAFAVRVVGTVIPIAVDCEWSGKCNSADIHQFVAEVRRLHGRVTLLYVPKSYWQQIGSPSFADIKGVGMWNARYPGGTAYPGNNSTAWNGYAGHPVVIWQYSDGNGKLDLDAFKGTRAQLCVYLECWAPKPTAVPTIKPIPRPPAKPTARHSRFVTNGPHRVVGMGSTGNAVVVVQKSLGGLKVDGRFGPLTRGAVKRFQGAHRLPRTGIVNAKTWHALYLFGR
jgi:GH25 family lysozyme M1 (1,4-beta-N-acetylmuramidase)